MSTITDERLAELIANAAGATEEAWWLDDVADALTELQSLRSQPAGVRVKGRADLLVQLARIIARNVDEERFYDAPGFQRAADEILSALEPQQEEAVAEPFMWIVQWEWKKDPGQEIAGGGTSYSRTEAAADAEVTRLKTAPQLEWAKKIPLYAHPTPAQKVQESQTVGEDMVERAVAAETAEARIKALEEALREISSDEVHTAFGTKATRGAEIARTALSESK